MTSTKDVSASSMNTSVTAPSATDLNSSPTPPSPKKKSSFQEIMIIAIFVILMANTGLFAYIYMKSKTPAPAPIPTPTPIAQVVATPKPTPTPYPLPQGKQSYSLSYGKDAQGPKIMKVTVDPFDPKPGVKQTYTIMAQHTSPILTAELTLNTDNKVATYSMERTSGTDTDGVWSVTVTTNDTHYYTYYPYFSVKSAEEKFQGGLTFRAY